jgi:N-acetylglucosamine kinase-like BadF-type ATPase
LGGGYVLGVDWGGSGTRCVISDLSGKILARARAANEFTMGNPANIPRATGAERAVVLGALYPTL